MDPLTRVLIAVLAVFALVGLALLTWIAVSADAIARHVRRAPPAPPAPAAPRRVSLADMPPSWLGIAPTSQRRPIARDEEETNPTFPVRRAR